MYKLTTCKCGTDIMQVGGCCGNPPVVIYNCPCGEEYLKIVTDKNKDKVDKAKNIKESQGDKKCHL